METTTERGLSKTRIEALSDGIFAFAMTLLILDVKIPSLEPGQEAELPRRLAGGRTPIPGLCHELSHRGRKLGRPSRSATLHPPDRSCLPSGRTCSISWRSRRCPFRRGSWANIHDNLSPIVVYCGNLIAAGLLLFGQLRYAAGRGQLFDPDIDPRFIAAAGRRILMGPKIYVVAAL